MDPHLCCRCRWKSCFANSFASVVLLAIRMARPVPRPSGASFRPAAAWCASIQAIRPALCPHRPRIGPSEKDGLARNLSPLRQAVCGPPDHRLVCPSVCVAAQSLGGGVEPQRTNCVNRAGGTLDEFCLTDVRKRSTFGKDGRGRRRLPSLRALR